MIQPFPPKTAGESLRYYWDWANRLAFEGVGPIVSHQVVLDGGPDLSLVVGDVAVSPEGDVVMAWLSGGTTESTYVVCCTVTLGDGSVIEDRREITIDTH